MTLRLISIFATLLVGLSPAAAYNINLYNNETVALLVQVWDENTPDEKKVYSGTLDSSAGPIPVETTPADGLGRVKWEATTTDRQKCGSGEEKDLNNGGRVTLTARQGC